MHFLCQVQPKQFLVRLRTMDALLKLPSLRNGRWRGVWTCKFAPGSGSVEVTGKLKVNVHYYEDGNVQLTTETPKAINVTGGGSVSSPSLFLFFFSFRFPP